MEKEIYCDADPMNPLCDIWTFKGANQWYETKQDAEEAYKDFCKQTQTELQTELQTQSALID